MELLVILLAIGLSSSEKLDRGYSYLPPQGAKLTGGSSGDLQTPLEYPNENPTFESGDGGYQNFEGGKGINAVRNIINNDSLFKSGSKNEAFVSIATENTNRYTQTTMYPRNGFDTVATEIPEKKERKNEIDAGIQNYVSDNRYPMKGISIMQGTESLGYHYGKPENMQIAATGILGNYKPNEFGMYGGKPMIIQSYSDSQATLNNMLVEPNGISDYPSNGLKSDEIGRGSQNDSSVSLNPNFNKTKTYKSTINPMKTVKSLNPIAIKKLNKNFQERPQRPQAESDRTAAVLNYKNIIAPEQYAYSFDTSNGIHMDETATTIDGVKASGSYSYTGDDGKVYSVIYTADENGFQPKGDHLPTPPPIPEAIQKVIEQAKIDKEAGISHDGSYDEEKYGHMKYQTPVERYLQNMQVSHKPRNRDNGFRKIERKPMLPKDTDKYRINGKKVIERNRNVFRQPVNNFNGQFGIRIDMPVKNNNQKALKQLPESSVESYTNKVITNQNKEDESINFVRNKPIETHNHYQEINSGKTIHEYKDSGYYYVPPRQIFVEGRLQDTPSNKKTLNQLGILYEDLNSQSIPTSGLYYVDQRKNNESPKYPFINTTGNVTTKGPELTIPTNASNFYDSTTSDKNELDNSEKDANTNGVVTTPKPDRYILNTDAYDQENTKYYLEETVFPEQRDENEDNFEKSDKLVLFNLSTTPIPSEMSYPKVLSDSNQYEAFNFSKEVDTTEYPSKYPEGDGYFITKPDIQISFEDFPSSTNVPFYTVNEIRTETIPNIKVDGFGRPIQDSQQFYGETTNFGYTETPFIERADDRPQTTATFYNFEEPIERVKPPEDDIIINFNLGDSEQEIIKNMDIKGTDKIIGEDFSGPKQPQRYDSSSGYFY